MTLPMTNRNQFMLTGLLARKGYDWWWHNFTARHESSGAEKAFFIEYFVCNPALGGVGPRMGEAGGLPSYGMLKVGCWGEDARQVHDYFGWDEIEIGTGELAVRMGQNQLSETQMRGSVAVTAEAASLTWNGRATPARCAGTSRSTSRSAFQSAGAPALWPEG